jgi:threonyl-tRNA synthetase
VAHSQQLDNSPGSEIWKKRHTAAHVLAQAVLQMFPDARLAIGPPIDDGFYYDFELPRSLTPADMAEIESRMKKIRKLDYPLTRTEKPRADAIAYEEARGQSYKAELINDLPEGETISFYTQHDFTDLCRGPHVDSTGQIGVFKIDRLAGAYWRGDEKRPQLQRIYGVLFDTQEELDAYYVRLEEAKKRDHRVLGKQLGLFAFSEDIGPGIPLFLPKGESLRHTMETYVRDLQTKYGYQHVWTGHIAKEELYRKSGHLDNYGDKVAGGMFPPMVDPGGERIRLKPMNCPSHMTLFNTQMHSYRDLPLRYAEFATLYRYEKSGELNGLTRVRSLTQDDCHIFCTPDQIESEFTLALKLIRETLQRYGFDDYYVRLSLRDDDPESKFVRDDEKWNLAEAALRSALDANNVDYVEARGEAAFYGPKADFLTRDVLGREWQISTIQVDFIQPARLGCSYIGEDSHPHTPVVLHRAVTGSTERFLAILIEQYAGAFPAWLAPVQALVLPIADRHKEYAETVKKALMDAGFRVEVDTRNEKVGKKIAEAETQKVPYMLVVGDRDASGGTVSVRQRGGTDLGALSLDDFRSRLREETSASGPSA